MAVKIRLRRMAQKNLPLSDRGSGFRYPRDGRSSGNGYYNPMEEPSVVKG